MTQFIAVFGVLVLMTLAMLGNFWFTYGLWPQSWIAFGVFFVINTILSAAFTHALKDRQ